MISRRTIILLLIAVFIPLCSLFFLRIEPSYVVIPRSFTGAALLTQPMWFDLAAAFIVILTCWQWRPQARPTLRDVMIGALFAIGLMAFPLITGLALFVYVQDWYVDFRINWMTLARYLQFLLAYGALNLLIDALKDQHQWLRRGIVLLALLSLVLIQDVFLQLPSSLAFIVSSSIGTTLGLTIIAFRPMYAHSPWQAIFAAAVVGFIACFVVVAAISDSVFTFLLPTLALAVGAFSLRSARQWPRLLTGVVFTGLALFLSLGLPAMLPRDVASIIIENERQKLVSEQVGAITVFYPEPKFRDVAIRFAHVLEAANKVSEDEFGVSPAVTSFTLLGIGAGGFHADFPNRITGVLASERQLQLYADGVYLNSPELSIHFPDPVNAILHEYSHLYGVVPYWPWIMGPEEEGWATYAATRLALRLYENYGPTLWDPPYDYARQAVAIADANLQGHSVAWSHPFEFGGFQLWYALGQRDGERTIFQKRWSFTHRDIQRAVIISDPEEARRLARAMGNVDFVEFGRHEPVPFSQVIPIEALKPLSEVIGISAQDLQGMYETRATSLVDPAIRMPIQVPFWIDPLATLLLVAVFAGVRGRLLHAAN